MDFVGLLLHSDNAKIGVKSVPSVPHYYRWPGHVVWYVDSLVILMSYATTKAKAPVQCSQELLLELKPRAEALGLTLAICGKSWPWWELRDPKTGYVLQTGFDIDVGTALRRVERGRALSEVDLYNSRVARAEGAGEAPAVSETVRPGALCAFCGTPGGVPCPNMLAKATGMGISLKAPAAPNLHPGKCRAALKKLITPIRR